MNCKTYLTIQFTRMFQCSHFKKLGCTLPRIQDCVTPIAFILFFYYILDVVSSSVSIATYYRTNKHLNNYAYVYNQVYYPFLFALVIWSVYFISHYAAKLKTRCCPPKKQTIFVNPLLEEEDSGEEMSSYDIGLPEQGLLPVSHNSELSIWNDIKKHLMIYVIMAFSDTMTGLLIIPATLYLPSVDVLLFGRVVLVFNMFFSWCILGRKYNVLHVIAVILLFVGIAFAVLPGADISIDFFLGNLTFTNSTSDGSSGKGIFFSLLGLILFVELLAALSSIYKEHVLQKYRLQPLRTVAIVATIQPIFSAPTILLLAIPFPQPWFHVPWNELGAYILDASKIPFISVGLLNNTLTESLPSVDSYFLLYYLIYLLTNVLANVVDVIFIQTVSSTFNIIVNVGVIVISVFALSQPWLAGEAQSQITWYTWIALFFIVIATIQFKAGSKTHYDTVDPVKKTAIPISHHAKVEIPEHTETRHYNLNEPVSNITYPPANTHMRKPSSDKTLNPFKASPSMVDIPLDKDRTPPVSYSASGSDVDDELLEEKED